MGITYLSTIVRERDVSNSKPLTKKEAQPLLTAP